MWLTEMASADKPQTMNLLVTAGRLQHAVQWGGHLRRNHGLLPAAWPSEGFVLHYVCDVYVE